MPVMGDVTDAGDVIDVVSINDNGNDHGNGQAYDSDNVKDIMNE